MKPDRGRVAGMLLLLFCLAMIGSLLALTGLRQFFIEPLATTSSNVIWFLLQVTPLLVVIPGMLRFNYRSAFLAIVVASLYFIHGVMLAVSEEMRTLGLWEVGFALLLILAATYLVRGIRAAGGD
jgi:uncharacterized membrane protein